MRPGHKLALAGGLLFVAVVAPAAIRFFSAVPAAPIAECKTGDLHGPYVEITLETNHHLVLTRADVSTPTRCPKIGVVVEKRMLELGFRIGGEYERPASASWKMAPVLAGFGVCLIVIGVLRGHR
jgi:hypothetical protein